MEEVDREYWLDRELWTQVEACLLADGKDPLTYQFKPHPPGTVYGGPYEIREPDPPPWAKLYHLATVSMDAGTLPYVVTKRWPYREFRQAEFLRWAQGKGVALPDWLDDIASSPRPEGGPQGGGEGAGRQQKPEASDAPLHGSERDSLLKMILGMAMSAYEYKPGVARNRATGGKRGSISADLQRLGLTLDADTVRKLIKEAETRFKDLIPNPQKP